MTYNENMNMNNPQRDIVLSPNEFVFVQNNTNGIIKTYAGPLTITISAQDSLVRFDNDSKKFKIVNNPNEAKQLFVSPPENWYAILKNPAPNDIFPERGKASSSPDLDIGRKVNIRGPVSFPLFPGQMAKVIRGHALRTNQYLLARVYEADAANANRGKVYDAEGKEIENTDTNYVNGQILVIKGTEISFYIPPTGIEVIPLDNDSRKGYVREAVTLERLEYCILKDEDGNKRYVHGPEVVFPEPTETFVTSPKGGYVFRAMELSPISGIYVKVIAEYEDENKVKHPVGEEMFITGNDQMIYYPRPEHAIINYDGKLMHHAIAIPEGEGRYVMNRLTGEINTVRGPAMYLPDPRTEVVVKRKLTEKQCSLWFPGNNDALVYNLSLNEKTVEKNTAKNTTTDYLNFTACYSTADTATTLANLESKANISRGTSYTKPRTITLDTKYDGVVSIDVWTGYAVNVVSKDGTRKVVCGPQTVLLDYDQTLETLTLSTGKPKTTDNCINTVYLRHENNQISDIINIETKDFVKGSVRVSYCVNFDKNAMDKWFNIENYVKFLCDRIRSEVKKAAKNFTIEEFYSNYATIIHDVAICATDDNFFDENDNLIGRYFSENGMYIYDCEVLSLSVEKQIADMLTAHQEEMVQKALELSDAEKRVAVATALAEAEKKEQELRSQQLMNKMALQREEAIRKIEIQSEINRKNDAERIAAKEAERDMQALIDAINDAKIARDVKNSEFELSVKRAEADLEVAKQNAYTANVEKIMASIAPELVAAMTSTSNAQLMETVAKAMSPVAMARGESVAETTNLLLRGTPLEGIIKDAVKKSAE